VSYRVDKTGANDWMLEGGFLPPGILAAIVPGLGADHRRLMGAYDRLAMAVNTIGTPQSGSVNARGDVSFKVDGKQMATIHETLAYVVDSYLHGAADEVRVSGVRGLDDSPGTFDATWKGKTKQIAARLAKIAPTADRLAIASGHPQGGMRMNRDGHKGVVAPNFRVHGTSNLFVADASVFPSTITVNLQWTIMALAWMAGESIHRAIENG
jgi:choline dehydrogenase-like flavoprotein